ncbi:MAG TPA: glycosyltransferase, partial [Cytophagaceae bacterium]|nr:glycosyltransferase [Cytophagaceae bacterium]
MKVLMLHNRYKTMGGEDVSTDAETALLKSNGIDVETFFINNDMIDRENKLKLALNTVWSTNYYHTILKKLRAEKYDIMHVQNFFPLFSPSIFYAAQKAGVKVVMSIRNYRLICPNGLMYVKDNICFDCVGKQIPYPGVLKKCYRDSYGTSGVTATMLSIHNVLNTWKNKIDGFICISEFVKEQLISGGFEANQLHVKYNFVSTEIPANVEPEDYYIYVGRLSTEKGIDVLLNTFQLNKKKLIIIGDGPFKKDVEVVTKQNENISYLGKLPLNETYKKIANAKALIFPSKWHEPFGRTIVESFAHGTPVIGSALGGIKELIKNGSNGFLFDPYTK